jgi:hypothetical protein
MTKNEFLLTVATHAMAWGEGADFEMSELICENGELITQLEKHYNVQYEIEDNDQREWEKALGQCQKDAVKLLEQLKKQFECPIYAQKQMEKSLTHMENHKNNPHFYLKGKLEAIHSYKHDHNSTIKEAFDYVAEHGYTKDGNYK